MQPIRRITILAILAILVGGSHGSARAQQPYYAQPPAPAYNQPASQPGAQRVQASPQPAQPTHPSQIPQSLPASQPSAGQPMSPGPASIVPRSTPTLERQAPLTTASAPFQLTPNQEAQVDEVLQQWEEASKKRQRFACEFFRFDFVPAFSSSPDVPLHIDQGEACFSAPDKWMFAIHGEYVENKLVEGQRAERWVCDGNSIYEFDYPGKTVIQHRLSDDMKGEDLVRALLPFLFNPDHANLKSRYFIRLVNFSGLAEGHVCIDAWPRYQDEARNFRNAQVIIRLADMQPTAMMLVMPNGTDSHRYQFTKVKINSNNLLDRFLNDPFQVKIPVGWKKHVEQIPAAEVGNRPAAASRQ